VGKEERHQKQEPKKDQNGKTAWRHFLSFQRFPFNVVLAMTSVLLRTIQRDGTPFAKVSHKKDYVKQGRSDRIKDESFLDFPR
jgi:hypothetical protein